MPNFLTSWNDGNVSARENGSFQFDVNSGGAIDWGNMYASTTFNDTKNNRRILVGWSPEGTIDNFAMRQQGYQGAFAMPRILFNLETPGVHPPADLSQIQNSSYEEGEDGTYMAHALGSRPAKDIVDDLRNGSNYVSITNIQEFTGRAGFVALVANMISSYELGVRVKSTTGRTGVLILAFPDLEEYPTIWFDPEIYTIARNRTRSPRRIPEHDLPGILRTVQSDIDERVRSYQHSNFRRRQPRRSFSQRSLLVDEQNLFRSRRQCRLWYIC